DGQEEARTAPRRAAARRRWPRAAGGREHIVGVIRRLDAGGAAGQRGEGRRGRLHRLGAEGDYDPRLALERLLKDVTLATEMAGELLEKLPILRETLAAYAEGWCRGAGDEDFSAVTQRPPGPPRPPPLRIHTLTVTLRQTPGSGPRFGF